MSFYHYYMESQIFFYSTLLFQYPKGIRLLYLLWMDRKGQLIFVNFHKWDSLLRTRTPCTHKHSHSLQIVFRYRINDKLLRQQGALILETCCQMITEINGKMLPLKITCNIHNSSIQTQRQDKAPSFLVLYLYCQKMPLVIIKETFWGLS